MSSPNPEALPILSDGPHRGLTDDPFPAGWTGPRDVAPLPDPGPEPKRGMRPAKRAPAGLVRLWRYGRTLLNLLRRPTVVHDPPIHIQVESTDACNLHCTTCARDVIVDRATLLPKELWRKTIDEVRPTNLNVSGIGEPFLHPEIFELIHDAKEAGAAVNTATNFTRVKGRHRQIVESGIDQVKISIDATDPETFQAIRGEDAWSEIVENVREINRWKKQLGSATPSLRFNFAVQYFNFRQAPDLVDLAAELGVDGIYFQYLEYVDMEDRKAMLSAGMTEDALREALSEAERRAAEKNIVTNLAIWWRDWDVFWNKTLPLAEFKPNQKPCYFPWFTTWVGADGWVRPCPIMPWTRDEGRMGHLSEQSFGEIWNGPEYRQLRAALARGDRPTRTCKTCVPQSLYNIFYLRGKLLPDNRSEE